MRIGVIGAGPVGMAVVTAIKEKGKAELAWYVRDDAMVGELIKNGLKVVVQKPFDESALAAMRPIDPDNVSEELVMPARGMEEDLLALASAQADLTVPIAEVELVTSIDAFVEAQPDIILSCTKAESLLPLRGALSQKLPSLVFFVTNGFWLHPGIDLGVMFGGGYAQQAALSLIPAGKIVIGRIKSPYSEFLTAKAPEENKGTLIYKYEELEMMEELTESLDERIVHAEIEVDAYPTMARKAALNCLLNPLAALANQANGVLLLEEAKPIVSALSNEIVDVMNKASIMPIGDRAFSAEELIGDFETLSRKAGGNRGSFQLDWMRGRNTEIRYLNGLLLGIAQRFGLPMPVNATVIGMLACSMTVRR